MRRITSLSAVAVLAVLALSGCAAGYSGAGTNQLSEESAPDSGGMSAAYDANVDAPREVIVNGSVTVTVDSPADAAADAARIAETAGGRVDGRSEEAPSDGDKGRAQLTLRLPSKTLTASIDKLKELGEVQNVDTTTTDVTTQTQNLDARIDALAASIDRLQGFVKSAKSIEDLIALETSITERQGNLEAMQAEQRSMADQVSLSTIELYLISEADTPVETPNTFLSGLATGWESFVAFISGLLVTLGVLLPWLVFLGILALIALFVIRRATRRVVSPATPVAPEPAE